MRAGAEADEVGAEALEVGGEALELRAGVLEIACHGAPGSRLPGRRWTGDTPSRGAMGTIQATNTRQQ